MCEQESPFKREIKVDESYFAARRVRGRQGRGASGEPSVFGILQQGGKVYTEIMPDCAKATSQVTTLGKVDVKSVIHCDSRRRYFGLVDLGYKKHFRVQPGRDQFTRGRNHINGVESFWSFAKTRLMKFYGMSTNTFYLHMKESEFRFNNRKENIYAILLKLLRERPLN
jgi:transposase-like protein